MTDDVWKKYRKTATQEMRPYVKGESLDGISVSELDDPENETGGMIARGSDDPLDQWYINPQFFKANYEEAS